MEKIIMKEIVAFLIENPVQYLATLGIDGKVKCRPFMFCFEHDGKLWFGTSNEKNVYKEMKANNNVEFAIANSAFAWLRISCEVVFEDNMEVKENCMNIDIIKRVFGKASNPTFEVFYLANGKAVIYDVKGSPPMEFSL